MTTDCTANVDENVQVNNESVAANNNENNENADDTTNNENANNTTNNENADGTNANENANVSHLDRLLASSISMDRIAVDGSDIDNLMDKYHDERIEEELAFFAAIDVSYGSTNLAEFMAAYGTRCRQLERALADAEIMKIRADYENQIEILMDKSKMDHSDT